MMVHVRKSVKIFIILFVATVCILLLCALGSSENFNNHLTCFENLSKLRKSLRENKLLDLNKFRYINDNQECKRTDQEKDILGVILVTSYVGNRKARDMYRLALPKEKLHAMGFVRVFLLGTNPPLVREITEKAIDEENELFGDLVQGNFFDTYRNLSHKHIMGLKWAVMKCPRSKFIIKTADDTFFDVFYLKSFLEDLGDDYLPSAFIAGFVHTMDMFTSMLSEQPKWMVKPDGVRVSRYVSGRFYITNPNSALYLVSKAELAPSFVIDDIWITGFLRHNILIPLININSWFTHFPHLMKCCAIDLEKFSYECPYKVSPIGEDYSTMLDFLRHVEKCYTGGCVQRPVSNPLQLECI